MNTEVVMKRELFGMEVRQKSKSEFISATDLIKIGNKYRKESGLREVTLTEYFNHEKTKEFITEMEKEFGVIKRSSMGRYGNTWVHPILFMDIALWMHPGLKLKVYQWLKDNLLKYRNSSGDSFKIMAGSIYNNPNYAKYDFCNIISVVAKRVACECGVEPDDDRWQTADEQQLMLRDRMHQYIAIAADLTTNLETAIEVGIGKAKEEKRRKNE